MNRKFVMYIVTIFRKSGVVTFGSYSPEDTIDWFYSNTTDVTGFTYCVSFSSESVPKPRLTK